MDGKEKEDATQMLWSELPFFGRHQIRTLIGTHNFELSDIIRRREEWAGIVALLPGSLLRKVRREGEAGRTEGPSGEMLT